MITKETFDLVAKAIRETTEEGKLDRYSLINQLAYYFALNNPTFNRQRFISACDKEN